MSTWLEGDAATERIRRIRAVGETLIRVRLAVAEALRLSGASLIPHCETLPEALRSPPFLPA